MGLPGAHEVAMTTRPRPTSPMVSPTTTPTDQSTNRERPPCSVDSDVTVPELTEEMIAAAMA
jgi:hypothetical protein